MNGVLAIVAAAALGIDVGWQPLDDGGFEYIIQLEPQTLESLRDGQDLSSQVPPFLQGVRTYRITVGNSPLPHEGEPPPATANTAAVAKVPATGAAPPPTYQYTPPPAAEVPTNPNFAPNATGGMRYAPNSTSAAPTYGGSSQPGQLHLPPPPADPSVPPLHSEAESAPTTPPSSPPYEPPSATTRPSLGTDTNTTSPASPGNMQNPPPSAAEPAGSSPSAAPSFSFPARRHRSAGQRSPNRRIQNQRAPRPPMKPPSVSKRVR